MRRSITDSRTVSGVGLHTGKQVEATLRPGDAGDGIVFRRTDLKGKPVVPASVDHVSNTDRRTSLAAGDVDVQMVEHVLAAAAALGIDDLVIDVSGPELPILDGSAQEYFASLQAAGTADLEGSAKTYAVQAPLVVRDDGAVYVVAPSDQLRLTTTIEWDHPLIGRQSGCFDVNPEAFDTALARARTFGFASEFDDLRARGLLKGASPSCGIVLSESDVVHGQLRWPDEFVRHKSVDLLGDLALIGGQFRGDIVAFRPSHRGNAGLVRALRRAASLQAPPVMGIQEILGVIPHRYPMLLVDRIVEIEPGTRIVGIKNVTMNEPFFQGHFPEHPIMPGVLIVEAMAQVGGMLFMGSVDNPQDKVVYFMSIDNVKFRRPVVPGDQIRFELEILHLRGRNCRMRGVGFVDGRPAAEAEMMARVVDR